MSFSVNPNVLQAYDRLLSGAPRDTREEDPKKPLPTPTVTLSGVTPPVIHATQSDIVIAFMKVSDQITKQLKDMRDCLDDLNKKVEDLNKRMSNASKQASDLSASKDGSRSGNDSAAELKKLGEEMKNLKVTHGDVTVSIDMSFKSPDASDSGKKGAGLTKDQWTSASNQLSTDIAAIQTQVKSLSGDMQINISNWQTFSGQLIKGLEQMASGLTRIAGSD